MTPSIQPRVHALLRLDETDGVRPECQAPHWAHERLLRAPWVVVRRSAPVPGWCAAGVRGTRRSERCAIWVPEAMISKVVTPEDLAQAGSWTDHPRRRMVPAIDALPLAATILRELVPELAWGPTGSVGLELASGAIWATDSSDLDLMLRADDPVAKSLAQAILRAFALVAVRLDLLIETPLGGVALADWALHDGPWLLRTNQGPRLVDDPWDRLQRMS